MRNEKKNLAKVNRYDELCKSFPRISNSFPRIAIRSLDSHNLFSRIGFGKSRERFAVRENELCKWREHFAIRDNELSKSSEEITYPW